ncbi:helix-turn-helix domain-containing protein [Affinibrenneria salicis]|uniref:Helix-turn-helix domain-containing protein n=2 Tax=Affinibrenneria salicis TaxID=2590031 RepID=A0A5J5G9K2_9GAMM|nr:helix-turn-helix domain-containing protein [Affinibrenneria salicis]KAA9003333.1 helix-turn-helix domain-containing protein [Affinibrenneria salicis]
MNYYRAWWRGDIDWLMSLYSPQVEYNDFFQGCRIAPDELRDYLHACLSKPTEAALRYIDRLRVDGDTATLQYQTPLSGSDSRAVICCCEIITVCDGMITRVNEYASLLSQGKTPPGGADSRATFRRLGLSARQLSIMSGDIQQYFSQQRPYLNPELSLIQVASATGYTRNQISFFLNQVMGCSFYQYLNRLRLRHVLTLWDNGEGQQHRIDDDAKAAGFHSLSTFYRCFREETGLAPKSYLRQKISGRNF